MHYVFFASSASPTYAGNSDSPTSVTDQRGNVMTYSYNSSGQLTGIGYANSTGETFTYNASGQLIRAVERSGDRFDYSYDASGRLTRKTFDDGTFEQYTYDIRGNLTSVRDVRGGTTAMVYDTENRLTRITYPNGRFLRYAYDAQGRRTQMVDQSGFTTNYSYDAAGRLAGLTNGAGATIISYTYDTAGRLMRETNGNGTFTTYAYDAAGQLTGIVNRRADNTINSSFQYTYDALGRQTRAVTLDGTWTYTYDATGQLTRAQFASTNTAAIPNQDLQYVYDAAGNRIQAIVNGVTTNYTTNNLNQYTTVGAAQHFYDADGNLIRITNGTQTWTYTYNDENRLIRAVTPTGTFDYEYDAFGNRTASIQNGVRTEYLVDPFGLGDVVGEYSGGTAANYVHGLGLIGRFSGGTGAYYDSDAIGSTIGLTNSAGSYVNRYVYRPYGENLITTEGVANPFEYVGQWGVMDEASGLDYMRARFYSPSAGRFTNPDPIGQSGGINLYTYAVNTPANLVDPQGTSPLGFIVLAALVGGTVNWLWYAANPNNYSSPTNFISGSAEAFVSGAVGGGLGAVVTLAATAGAVSAGGAALLGGASGMVAAMAGDAAKLGTGGKVGPQDAVEVLTSPIPSPVRAPKLLPPFLKQPFSSSQKKLLNEGAKKLRDLTGQAENTISPLVLDLDNDGIELTSLQNSTAFFDLDADGFAEQAGWVKSDDGILALDRNNNGRIDDITELFGNATTDGFIILKQLDSNNDNIINSQDAQFANLRIWKDANEDGFSDTGELQSLGTWGIQSINLNYQTVNLTNEGNRISSTSTYTRTDGTTRQIVDVWFALDQMNTVYSKEYQLKSETLFLPTLRGYGELPDLYIAMSKDPGLLSRMRNLVALNTSDYEQFHTQFLAQTEAFLYHWAGVQAVAPNSRGGFFDARKLGFLEAFFGQDFRLLWAGQTTAGDPGPQASNVLEEVWYSLFRSIAGRLVVQGSMRSLFPKTSLNLSSDSLESAASLDTILNALIANSPTSSVQAALYWHLAVAGLDSFEVRFNLTQADYDNRISQALANTELVGALNALRQPDFLQRFDDAIVGTSGNDNLAGGIGNDQINGLGGNDTISGGSGDDNLDGGAGNDTVNGNDGNDTIKGGQGIDILDGGNGIDTLQLDLSEQSVNLNITNPRSGINIAGVITAINFENIEITTGSGNDQIIQAAIANGTVLRGDDIFRGGAGDDVIDAGLGLNDQVDGGSGVDTLILNYGVDDVGEAIQFLLANSNANGISGSAGRWTANRAAWLDSISFSGIEQFTITATRNNDEITTWTGNDTINGGAGNDTINGGAGNDTINGGSGDDVVIVGLGNDTVDGGAGIDRLDLDLSNSTANLVLSNVNGAITLPGVVSATNFESLNVTTGSGNDTVTQAGVVNGVVIRGNDTISTGGGNDSINAGLGSNDRVDGGIGTDLLTVDFSAGDTGAEMQFFVNSGSGYAYRYVSATNSSYLDYLNFSNIERFIVTGTSKNDTITTSTGNDTVNAGDGNDTVNGGGGNDTLDGGAGTDKLTLDLSAQTAALNMTNYRSTGINLTGIVSAVNFEEFDLTTGSGNDTVTQAGVVNGVVIRGNDTISTGGGNDSINAGLGSNDRVDGGTGTDLLTVDFSAGDTGSEMWFYVNSGSGYAYRYVSATNSSYLDYLSFSNIEQFNIIGTSKNDNITTSTGNDIINAGDGNDTVNGGGGNDTLDGGAGTDKLTLDLSAQTAALSIANYRSAGVNIAGVVSALNFEEFDLTTGSGNDTVTQAGLVNGAVVRSNDTLRTGAGNDTINAGLGQTDSVDGGTGTDLLTVDFSAGDTGSEMQFFVNSGSGYAYRYVSATNFSYLDYLSFSNIERFNITGTSKNDNITRLVGKQEIIDGSCMMLYPC